MAEELNREYLDQKLDNFAKIAADSFGEVHKEIHGVRQEIQGVRQELKQEIHGVRQEMNQGFAEVHQRMDKLYNLTDGYSVARNNFLLHACPAWNNLA